MDTEVRRRWMRVLAEASTEELAALWDRLRGADEPEWLRGPEAGLVMVRGRVGGTGDRFNLGEAAVTRATVRVGAAVGTSYVLGSDLDHARYSALLDGLLQDPGRHERLLAEVVEPLEAAQRERDETARAEAGATVVDFLTVAREHE